jgi:Holliday junction DNA helicase RuvA
VVVLVSCEYFFTYLFFASKCDFIKLFPSSNKEMHILLFGFEKSEREIFKLLLSVSIVEQYSQNNVSSLDPKQITNAIASADVVTIQSIKGIGSKTAQRVILDLKEKVLKLYDLDEVSMSQKQYKSR